jgi:cytochrome oxidase Cu insertion factor (SCO1/SenC/PrrC family)
MHSNNVEKKVTNRKTLLIILFLFMLPVLISFVLYFVQWRPSNTVNYGELILPSRTIADRNMVAIDGSPVKFSSLHGKWTMVYFDTAACPESCMSQLFFMRQTHTAQGKNYDQMQRLMLLTDVQGIDSLKSRLTDYADMLIWHSDKAEVAKLLQEFGPDAAAADAQHYIYLLDPQGNLMMRYKLGAEPAGVRKDLERLLKYSN